MLADPEGACHVEAFQFLSVGQSVNRLVRLSDTFIVFYCDKLTVAQSLGTFGYFWVLLNNVIYF